MSTSNPSSTFSAQARKGSETDHAKFTSGDMSLNELNDYVEQYLSGYSGNDQPELTRALLSLATDIKTYYPRHPNALTQCAKTALTIVTEREDELNTAIGNITANAYISAQSLEMEDPDTDHGAVYTAAMDIFSEIGMKEHERTIRDFCLENFKNTPKRFKSAAGKLAKDGKMEEAIELLQNFLEKHPETTKIINRLAKLLIQDDQDEKAFKLIKDTIANNNDNLNTHIALHDYYKKRSHEHGSQEILNALLRGYEKHIDQVNLYYAYQTALALKENQQQDLAVEILEHAVNYPKLGDSFASAHNLLLSMYNQKQQKDDYNRVLQLAQEQFPYNPRFSESQYKEKPLEHAY